ncbi:MAG: serine hydrolase domain-containing protein [Polaribacter sp.]
MKTYTKNYILILLSIAIMSCKTIEKKTASKQAEIETKLDSIFISLNKNGKFNGNVLVAKNDEIIYKKEFGFSSGNKKYSLNSLDRFNIGSIYKEIPAIAVMQLKEKGLLKLDDPISKYVLNLPKWSKTISIKNLIQYTSGLPKVNWMKHKEINNEVLMNDIVELKELKFNPGNNYLYTNYSPFLLSRIVESISHKSFTEYVYQNILKPLKLKNSKFNKSFPYEDNNRMAISFNNEYVEDNPPFTIKSSGFLFSTTTEDLFKLMEKLHSYKIINESSILFIGKTSYLNIENMESALGQVEFKNGKITEHTHHGSSGNYESIIYRNNIKNITAIVLTNHRNNNLHSIKNIIKEIL